jgi:hypothetical protein
MSNNTIHPTKGLGSPNRFAYLLHLWRSSGQWRASLESLQNGKRLGFANPEQLFAYLMDLIEGNFNKQSHPVKEEKDEAEKGN